MLQLGRALGTSYKRKQAGHRKKAAERALGKGGGGRVARGSLRAGCLGQGIGPQPPMEDGRTVLVGKMAGDLGGSTSDGK